MHCEWIVAQQVKVYMKKKRTTNKPLSFITVNFGITRKSARFFQESPSTTEMLGIVMSVIFAVILSLTIWATKTTSSKNYLLCQFCFTAKYLALALVPWFWLRFQISFGFRSLQKRGFPYPTRCSKTPRNLLVLMGESRSQKPRCVSMETIT